MTVKKEYNIGDTVWIYGITPANKITKGTVIASIDLKAQGHGQDLYYIIDIPTHIDSLLEIRSWQTISQDEHGPVGSLRTIGKVFSENKKMRQVGYIYTDDSHYDKDDPSPAEIMAALEKSTDGLVYKPLNIKENKPKKRYYPRNKK
jgi:hypothetical protein